jgi:7-cyano-7-deazaguanine synthase
MKKAVVLHSGGFDSSLCLALAVKDFDASSLVSLSFYYGQRNASELVQAEKISKAWGIDHVQFSLDFLSSITENALIGSAIPIQHEANQTANTLVTGRNGLFARIAAIYAEHLGAACLYMGVREEEALEKGYRDCSRSYMDLKQEILRIDLGNPSFEIRTPLVHMSKKQVMERSYQEGIFEFLFHETISCYEGIAGWGCKHCPTCIERNGAIQHFLLNSSLQRKDL